MVEIKGDGEVLMEGAGKPEGVPAPSTPTLSTQCPIATCRSKEIAKLNQRAGMQLWECGKCLHGWETPLAPGSFVRPPGPRPPIEEAIRPGEFCAKGCGEEFRYPPEKKRHEAGCRSRRTKETGLKAKEATMAKTFECESCPEKFDSPWKRGAHARHAHGGIAKAKRAPKAAKATATKPPANGAAGGPGQTCGAVAAAIQTLETKRAEIVASIPELAQIDAAIAALKGLPAGDPS
jgi:hypothetical protein